MSCVRIVFFPLAFGLPELLSAETTIIGIQSSRSMMMPAGSSMMGLFPLEVGEDLTPTIRRPRFTNPAALLWIINLIPQLPLPACLGGVPGKRANARGNPASDAKMVAEPFQLATCPVVFIAIFNSRKGYKILNSRL